MVSIAAKEGKRARGAIFGAILAVLLVFGATSGSPTPTDHLPPWIASDVQWEADLLRWLRLSYVEDEGRAGFSMVPVSVMRNPDLYTTASAAGILSVLGYQLPNKSNVVAWVDSLQAEGGYCVAPGVGHYHSRLLDTERAIGLLGAWGLSKLMRGTAGPATSGDRERGGSK